AALVVECFLKLSERFQPRYQDNSQISCSSHTISNCHCLHGGLSQNSSICREWVGAVFERERPHHFSRHGFFRELTEITSVDDYPASTNSAPFRARSAAISQRLSHGMAALQ